MASLYAVSKRPLSLYKDRRQGSRMSNDEREKILAESTTLYVGNLSFYTTEEQIFDLFSKVGEIKRIIMGLDRIKKTPCGFCFVEYFKHEDAAKSVQFLCDTKLDERTIRVDYDFGFEEGRQYGRGKSGGQVRDEHRLDYDPGRGGYGKAASSSMSANEMWGNNSNDHHHSSSRQQNQHRQHQQQQQQHPPPMHNNYHQMPHYNDYPMNYPPQPPYMYNNNGYRRGTGRGRPYPGSHMPMHPPHQQPRYYNQNDMEQGNYYNHHGKRNRDDPPYDDQQQHNHHEGSSHPNNKRQRNDPPINSN